MLGNQSISFGKSNTPAIKNLYSQGSAIRITSSLLTGGSSKSSSLRKLDPCDKAFFTEVTVMEIGACDAEITFGSNFELDLLW